MGFSIQLNPSEIDVKGFPETSRMKKYQNLCWIQFTNNIYNIEYMLWQSWFTSACSMAQWPCSELLSSPPKGKQTPSNYFRFNLFFRTTQSCYWCNWGPYNMWQGNKGESRRRWLSVSSEEGWLICWGSLTHRGCGDFTKVIGQLTEPTCVCVSASSSCRSAHTNNFKC